MTRFDKENLKHEVIDYLVVNRDSLAHLVSNVVKEYDVRRHKYMDFLLDFNKERDSQIKTIIKIELSNKFGIDADTLEEILGDVNLYNYVT